jgi:hypothetical protein
VLTSLHRGGLECSSRYGIGTGAIAISGVSTKRESERGGSKLKTLLLIIVLGAFVFAAVKIVPPYFANYQMQDSMETEARFAIANRKPLEEIRDDVWKKAQELGIPTKRDDIKVTTNQSAIEISIHYTVPIDLQVYQFTLDFHPHADNRTI